jgi:putative membrane protein
MQTSNDKYIIQPNSRWQNTIIVVSVLIPLVVAVLIYLPPSARLDLLEVGILPHINGMLNSATAVCLLISLFAVKSGRLQVHKVANLSAFFLSALFLVSYVLYHYLSIPTVFGDTDHDGILSEVERATAGGARNTYILLLLSHIVLAAAVVPLVLFSMYYSLSGQIARHKKLSRFTWPVWFYVAVTGVVVYILIRPYYGF